MTEVDKLKVLATQAALGTLIVLVAGSLVLIWGARFAAKARVSFLYAFGISCLLQAAFLVIGALFGWFFSENLAIAFCIAVPTALIFKALILHRAFRSKNPSSPVGRTFIVALIYEVTSQVIAAITIGLLFA